MSENKIVLNNLVESKNNIKRKIMELKRGVLDSEYTFNETFKPIIEPLNMLVNDNKMNNVIDEELSVTTNEENADPQLYEFNNFMKLPPNRRSYDPSYGMRYDNMDNQLKIGNFPVFIANNKIYVADKDYDWTPGLWSLLCEKNPKLTTRQDFKSYYKILDATEVHLNVNGGPKSSQSHKWTFIVKPYYTEKMLQLKTAKRAKLDVSFIASKAAEAAHSKDNN